MQRIQRALQYIHNNYLYSIPVLCIGIILLLSLRNQSYSLFPGVDVSTIESFTDLATSGNSEIEEFSIDSSVIRFRYTLKQQTQYPYAGLKFGVKTDSTFADYSQYDYVKIRLNVDKPQNIDIHFHTYIPGFTDEKNLMTYRFLTKTVICEKTDEQLIIPLKAFTTPLWWYYDKKFSEDSLGQETFRQVTEVIVQSGFNAQSNVSYGFTLKEFSFHKKVGNRLVVALGAILLWLGLYFLIYYLFRSKPVSENTKMVISYEPLTVNNDSDDSLARIVNYIAKEYKNPDLTVNQVGSDVGILPVKVTQILKEKKNCSYKQYLNAIRLAEAKRLLRETDRNIVDIATKVGYNNVTHFNRIFKEIEGISPRQFRSGDTQTSDTAGD